MEKGFSNLRVLKPSTCLKRFYYRVLTSICFVFHVKRGAGRFRKKEKAYSICWYEFEFFCVELFSYLLMYNFAL